MPQMKPMNWMLIYFLFSLTLFYYYLIMFFLNKNYFFKKKNKVNYTYHLTKNYYKW